jgi:beta-glucosidase
MDVAQIYLRIPSGQVTAPKRLVGWQKVNLHAGETRRVTVTVDPRATAIFDVTASALRTPSGIYSALLSSSSADRDVRLQGSAAFGSRRLLP